MRTALKMSLPAAAVAVVLGTMVFAAEKATVTGVVGDAMCGVKHSMGGDDAGCTRECVKAGSDYALIVGDKALTLKATSEATKAELSKLAGKKATVSGERDGDTVTVASVQPAK